MRKIIAIYVVTKNPEDYPGFYVLRRWSGENFDVPDHDPTFKCVTLDLMHTFIKKTIPNAEDSLIAHLEVDSTVVETYYEYNKSLANV